MAVEGKKKFAIYLDEETAEYVKSYLETTRYQGGLSRLFDEHLKTMAMTLKMSKYKPGEKIGVAKMLQIFKNGIKQDVV